MNELEKKIHQLFIRTVIGIVVVIIVGIIALICLSKYTPQ